MKAVIVEALGKRFGNFTAVNRITFAVEKGEIFGFLGPNGAGKSTTIRMLCGLLVPTSGRAEVAGFDVGRAPELVKLHIGYMSQKFSLYDDLNVAENIYFYAGIYGMPRQESPRRLAELIDLLSLDGLEKTPAGELSGGWKQRLALGCAIVHQPPVLFLDEPTSGVDPLSRRHFWKLIRGLAGQGTTVFVSTHFMDEAENCGRIAFINHGSLIKLGTPTELKRDSRTGSLEEAFVYYAKSVGESKS